MRKLFIHIGTHKTGSSALQRFILENQELLLSNGVVPIPFTKQAKILMDSEIYNEDAVQEIQNYVERFVSKFPDDANTSFLITSEGFSGHHWWGYKNTPIIAKALHKVFEDWDATIIVYLRRQDDFIESVYSQRIQEGKSYSFDEFLEMLGEDSFNWYNLLNSYGSLFGPEHVLPRPYYQFLPPEGNLVDDFFGICAPGLTLVAPPSRVNVSYSRESMMLAMMCNPSLTDAQVMTMRKQLQKIDTQKQSRSQQFFSSQAREVFMRQYAESNRKAAEEFYNSPGALFQPLEAGTDSMITDTSIPGSVEAVIPVIAQLIISNRDDIERIRRDRFLTKVRSYFSRIIKRCLRLIHYGKS